MSDLIAGILADDTQEAPRPEARRVLAFKVFRSILLPLLDKAVTVIPARDVMPVLKCFQLHVDPQRLRVVASDAEKTLIVSTREIATRMPGIAVFPAKKLQEIVKATPADDFVDIVVTGNSAWIGTGRAHWTLTLPSGADYPAMPAVGDARFVTVDRQTFRQALATVRYAASRDPSRPNLNVVDIHEGRITATNGTRIQQVTVPDLAIDLRISIAVVDDLMRLLKNHEPGDIHIGASDNRLIFRSGPELFIAAKEHVEFPDLEASLLRPALENKHHLTVDRHLLLDAIRRVRINADNDSAAIALTAENNTLTAYAKDRHGNTASETITADWPGDPHTITIHHGYLTDMINFNGEEQCCFRLGDDSKTRRSPLLLRRDSIGALAVAQQMQADWGNR